jgi:hypothetical protein
MKKEIDFVRVILNILVLLLKRIATNAQMKKEIDFVRVILNTLVLLAKKNCHRLEKMKIILVNLK